MKEKLLAALKPLLADKGLSKDEVESLAELYAKNLTETSTEEEINNVANSVVPIADLMQKSSSRQVSAIKDKYKDYVPKPKPEPNEPPKPNPNEPPAPPAPPAGPSAEDIKKMIDEAIRPYKEKEDKARLTEMLMKNEKVAKMPEFFRKHYTLEKEEDLDTVVAQMETDFAEATRQLVNTGNFVAPPKEGNGEGGTDDLIQRMHEMAEQKS